MTNRLLQPSGWTLLSLVLGLGLGAICLPAAGATYSNTTPINTGSAIAGPTPYPSVINVGQLSGELTSVAVTLVNVTHPNPDDLDILLLGPGGQTVLLMSDAGGTANVTNVSLTFAEISRVFIPDAGPLQPGVYLPSNYESGPDTFPSAPAPPFGNKLTIFDGDNPNGAWRLFAIDDNQIINAGGIAGGWRLTLTTTNRPPVITTRLQDQTVMRGANVTFRVGVTGTPPFGYQWMFNGIVIVPFGQGTDTLQLFAVQPNQSGIYSVVVTNGAALPASVGDSANLLVIAPPQISEPLPRLIDTQPGGVVTLRASATGTPPLHYQWLRNGTVLSNQTSSTLRLVEVTPFDAGNYGVVIWNDYGTVRDGPTFVRVNYDTGPGPKDSFRDRTTANGNVGVVRGDSLDATAEPGEPVIPGGGKTMWLQLTPTNSGILTLRTKGSTFDTHLSVFRGQDFRELQLITQDDDRGGFTTSELQFNVRRGEAYQIQVDGFGRSKPTPNNPTGSGIGGPFTLSWNLEVIPTGSQVFVPVIVSNPAPRSVVIGQDAVFRVLTEEANVTYQWYFLGPPYDKAEPLPNQTSPTLVIRRPGSKEVGFYQVIVRNQFDRFVISPAVGLQLGNFPSFFTDKFPTMYFTSLELGEFSPIGFGNALFNEVPSEATSGEGDPDPCGSPFFGTLWQGLIATNSGVIQVDTTGSAIGTRLAVYRLTGGEDDFEAPALICDLTSAVNGVPAIAHFSAENGTNYTVVVEGYNGSGNIQITTQMGLAPPLTNALKYCLVEGGGGITLQMPATGWSPVPFCQWRFNGVNIPNATNSSLTVSGFTAMAIGTYSVFVSNFVSSTTRDVAFLDLAPPFTLHPVWIGGGTPSYRITASNAYPFVIESTANLGTGPWTPIATNPDPCLVLRYTNNIPLSVPRQFYRAVPWSP